MNTTKLCNLCLYLNSMNINVSHTFYVKEDPLSVTLPFTNLKQCLIVNDSMTNYHSQFKILN